MSCAVGKLMAHFFPLIHVYATFCIVHVFVYFLTCRLALNLYHTTMQFTSLVSIIASLLPQVIIVW